MNKLSLFIFILFFVVQSGFSQNYALDLDGTNDKLGVNDSPELNPTAALTVEAWIKADSWGSDVWADNIISKQVSSPDRGYGLTVGENGKVEFTLSIDNAWSAATSPSVMGLNQWYHLAGVFDGSTIKVYVNGILQATTNISGSHSDAGGSPMFIGDNPTWSGRYFDGQLDEIRVWNIARTQTEIQTDYINELTGTETGLVAYWNINDGPDSTTAADVSVNSNDATLLNMDAATDWVNGFVVPVNDLGVVGIASPSMIGPGFTSSETIKIEVKNYTNTDISSFDVSYRIDGGSIVTETVNATVPAFNTYVHAFSGAEDLSAQTSYSFKAWTTKTGDNSNINDTLESTIQQVENIMIFDQVQHNFGGAGQTHINPIYMPENFDDYSQILLYVDLTCPGGGCDPWDQAAKISVIRSGSTYELARYITPYGVACGNWTFDITDFKSLLTGNIIFESFIQVWGASGWLVSAELELVQGTPGYQYSLAYPLWNEDNWIYGDPGISYDLPIQTINIPATTQDLKVRMSITGHGQGNTDNAAEFKEVTHHLWLNGAQDAAQNLWKDDCASNTCSPQNGTYTYSRAGWCPGQDVQPYFFDLAGKYTAGQNLQIDYVLENYTNALNTGYNGSSHTGPYYRIHAYLIAQSNSPLMSGHEITSDQSRVSIFPNPAENYINIVFDSEIQGKTKIVLTDMLGRDVFSKDAEMIEQNTLHFGNIQEGIYIVRIIESSTNKMIHQEKIILKR